MKGLIREYKETLKITKEMIRKIEEQLEPLEAIINDKHARVDEKEKAYEMAAPLTNEKSIISGMKSDLEYAIEWMTTARRPGAKRGIDNRRAYYEKEQPMDPSCFEYIEVQKWEEPTLSKLDKGRLEYALSILSPREKEVYILLEAKGFSQYKAAELLCISRGALQTIYKRAKKKMEVMKNALVV